MLNKKDRPATATNNQPISAIDKQIASLIDKKSDIEVLIRAIEVSLKESGYLVEDRKATKQETGIRIRDQLSFRGCDKAAEFFRILDEDDDGLVGFEDIRAMHSLTSRLGLVQAPEHMNWDAWKMHMWDHGLRLTDHCLTINEFIKYRQILEPKQSLVTTLHDSGMSCLPEIQERWKKLKLMIQEAIDARVPDHPNPDLLNTNEASFVLAAAGIPYSKYEYILAMCVHTRHEIVMQQLLTKFLKKNLTNALPNQVKMLKGGKLVPPVYTITKETLTHVKPDGLLAWLFADRIPSLESHLKERAVFKAPHIIPPDRISVRNRTALRVTAKVGQDRGGSDLDGTNISWKLSRIDHPIEYLKAQKLPKDCGGVIVIDFLLQTDADPAAVKRASFQVKQCILHHYNEELSKNAYFRGIYCFPAVNTTDNANVLRLAIAFKRQISIDSYLESCCIPYCLHDIFFHFSGEITSSVHIADMFENQGKHATGFDHYFYGTCNFLIEYNKEVVLTIIQNLKLAFATGYTVDSVFGSVRKDRAVRSRPGTAVDTSDKWAVIRKHFPKAVEYCKLFLKYLERTSNATMSFKLSKLSEISFKAGMLSSWVRKWFPEELFKTPNGLHSAYKRACSWWNDEIVVIFKKLEKFLWSEQHKKEAAMKRTSQMTEKERRQEEHQRTKKELLEKLLRLGVAANERDIINDIEKEPEEYAEDVKASNLDYEIIVYETVEKLKKILLGVHSCDVVLGKSRLAIAFTGFDFMDLVPEPPSIDAVKQRIEERHKQLVKEAEDEF